MEWKYECTLDIDYRLMGHSASDINEGLSRVSVVCGGLIRSSVGTIQSKNYPNVYGDNSNCTWRVAVQPHRKIKVQVNAIDIFGRVDGQCTGDYLEVRCVCVCVCVCVCTQTSLM